MPILTKRQKQIFDFISKYINKHGVSPTFEEIGKSFKLKAPSTIHQHIETLVEKGYLNKNENSRGVEVKKSVEDFISVPLAGTIAAGQPIEAVEEKETIAIPKINLPFGKEIFALKVVGDSMIQENINDGDIILAKKQPYASNGDRVIALIDNSEATLKKFFIENNQIRLQPANAKYKSLLVKPKDLIIQGVVIDVIKNITAEEKQEAREEIKKYNKLPLNEIIHGDAVEIMKALPPDSIDLVVTSPPYDELRRYNGYSFNFEGMAKSLFRVIKKGGVVVWVVGDQTIKGDETGTSFRQALYFKQVGFDLFDTMIYLKTPRGAVGNNKTYWQTFEYMFILSKGTPKTINLIKDRENKDERGGDNGTKRLHDGTLLKLKRAGYSKYGRRTNVWEYLIGKGHSTSDDIAYKHPAIFPEKLVQDHITSWSNPGDVVFDPMCGSGTTCKMAKLNKRDFIGIDISSEYCKIAEERLRQKPLF